MTIEPFGWWGLLLLHSNYFGFCLTLHFARENYFELNLLALINFQNLSSNESTRI